MDYKRSREILQGGVKKIVGVTLIVGLFGFLFSLSGVAVAVDGWYNSSWSYRRPLTIDHTKITGGAHTSFPVLVALTLSDPAKPQADGDDFLFTAADGVTKLDHEIEAWDSASGKLVAWVRVPALDKVSDTLLYLYYGNVQAASQQSSTAVWDSLFAMVQHMSSSTSYRDSTANAITATPQGALSAGEGQISAATHFNGVNTYVQVPGASAPSFANALTLSFWLKNETVPAAYDGVIGKPNGWWTDSYGFFYQNSSALTFFINHYVSGAVTAAISPQQWNYIVGAYDGAQVSLYINGQSAAARALSGPITTNNYAFDIGRLNVNDYNIDGFMDEVRLAQGARSAAWIATEYANQSSPQTFVTAGAPETNPADWHFSVTGAASQVAGSPQTITLTLVDGPGAPIIAYTGDKIITLSGPGLSPSGTNPTCTDKNGAPVAIGTPFTLAFAQGSASCALVLYQSAPTALDASDVLYSSQANPGYDLDVTVSAAAFAALGVSMPATVTSTEAFTTVVTSTDAYGNRQGGLSQPVNISLSRGTVTPTSIPAAAFADTGSVTTSLTVTLSAMSTTTLTLQSGVVSSSAALTVAMPAPLPSPEPIPAGGGGGINYVAPAGPSLTPSPAVTTTAELTPTTTVQSTATTTPMLIPADTLKPIRPSSSTAVVSTQPPVSDHKNKFIIPALPRPLLPGSLGSSLEPPLTLQTMPVNEDNGTSSAGLLSGDQKFFLSTITEIMHASARTMKRNQSKFIPWQSLTEAQKNLLPHYQLFARSEKLAQELVFSAPSAATEFMPELPVAPDTAIDLTVRVPPGARAVTGYLITQEVALGDTATARLIHLTDTDKDHFYQAALPIMKLAVPSRLLVVIDFSDPTRRSEIVSARLSPAGAVAAAGTPPVSPQASVEKKSSWLQIIWQKVLTWF